METQRSVAREGSWFRQDANGLLAHRERLMDAISRKTYDGKYRVRGDGIALINRNELHQELRETNEHILALENQTGIEALHDTVKIVILGDNLQPDRLEHQVMAEEHLPLMNPIFIGGSVPLQLSDVVYQI
jgi:hypothetical protein